MTVLNKDGPVGLLSICNIFGHWKNPFFFWECQCGFITIDSSDDLSVGKAQKSR